MTAAMIERDPIITRIPDMPFSFFVRSATKPGERYQVDVRTFADGHLETACECTAWEFNRMCWHRKAVSALVSDQEKVRELKEERTVTQMQVVKNDDAAAVVESVITAGDLGKLPPAERVRYYTETCRSMGLNPLTKPFDYITLNGKLTLYATRTATDQLRSIRNVSIEIASRERMDDVFVVVARASMPDGRTDEEIGAVNVAGLKGEPLANAMMKAQTKAKRRVTLSICGLGWLDESEIESVPTARTTVVNTETGELLLEHTTDDWRHELGPMLKDAGLTMKHLGLVLAGEVTRDNYEQLIGEWLTENPDLTVGDLVRMTLDEVGDDAPPESA